ncbi:phage portal protein [Novosphingobium sp.]|jgi:HK97 family phage portal protein|uniref:phage portal protein n=1 Tax=Novosphingobium sp. TaxID=1874826 RepID=UPI002FE40E9B
MFNLFEAKEARSLENPTVSLTDAAAWREAFSAPGAVTGEAVTEAKALGVTSIWQAVNVISGTIAALPLHLYKRTTDGAEKDAKNPLYYIVHDRPNDYQTATEFLKWLVSRLLLAGRATALISRNGAGRVIGLYPLDGSKLTVEQTLEGNKVKRTYRYALSTGTVTYDAAKVIDVVHCPAGNAIDHYNPITTNRDAIALMIAAQAYSSKIFANGGVPLLALNSRADTMSPQAAARAGENIYETLQNSVRSKSSILVPPTGHSLDPIGLDPAKSQLLDLRKFMLAETSRIFNVAPAVLHDLSGGTYSNVEQQNLSFAQQTLTPLIKAIEQEMNGKLFGPRNNTGYVEFSMAGLLRGDFSARMEGLQKAVNAAIFTPNEARAFENLPAKEGGDNLFIQGASVPLSRQLQEPEPTPPPAANTTQDDPADQADETKQEDVA